MASFPFPIPSMHAEKDRRVGESFILIFIFPPLTSTEGYTAYSQVTAAELDRCSRELSASIIRGFGGNEEHFSAKAATGYGEPVVCVCV